MDSMTLLAQYLPLAAGKIHWTEELSKWFSGNLLDPWIWFGFGAQGVFFARFVAQWIASERRGQSYIPTVFWYLSLAGTAMLAAYAVHRRDPVFIVAQILSSAIYIRNLMLIYSPKTRVAQPPSEG